MSHAYSSHETALPQGSDLSTIVYRSRAVLPMSSGELYDLALAAQIRNRRESITGLVLYDDSCFFQWLEGPTDKVERIMRDIRNDPRHTDVEVLKVHPSAARSFATWDMKLATLGAAAPGWQRDVLEPPVEIVEYLRKRPEAAPTVLLKLVPVAADPGLAADPVSRAPMRNRTAAVLKDVLLRQVIPALMDQYGLSKPGPKAWTPSARAAELAELLLAADETASRALIADMRAGEKSAFPLFATLFEPAARSLGDMWQEDTCTEFDVTLGLCRMQAAIRLLGADSLGARAAPRPVAPAVLIVPEPGELHRLGSAMDSEVLWNAGWMPRCAFPESDKDLQDLVAGTWFDVLDLSLSTALRREHWLPRVAATIDRARHASVNPALVVIVGGRAFLDQGCGGGPASAQVGADTASSTALDVQRLINGAVVGPRA